MIDLAGLLAEPRVMLVAELRPIAGTRFQPTGFADLGAAVYPSPADGTRLLLVESAQSVANRLEEILWPLGGRGPNAVVDGLPYVQVTDGSGSFLTSSRIESHRLASPYIRKAKFRDQDGELLLIERLGLSEDRPIDHPRLHRAIFDLDPLCLLHGVWFSTKEWPSNPKLARAITGFIEAANAQEAYSGGAKFDHVSPSASKDGRKQGFGTLTFPRTEFVASSIVASFVLDTSQIRRYALEQHERELLAALALLEVRGFLDGGLRLRTACDLEVVAIRGERPEGFVLPVREELESLVRDRIPEHREPLVGTFGA